VQAAHMDDTERLPCFATLAPQAAATTDAAVEKLTVWWPSPPVPTMSTHGTPGLTGIMWLRIALTIPATSCPVSPLAFSSTRNAAAWHGSAPSIMASTPAQASSLVRLFFCSSVSSSCFISAGMAPSKVRELVCATRARQTSAAQAESSGPMRAYYLLACGTADGKPTAMWVPQTTPLYGWQPPALWRTGTHW
jgi:hypothetical protein